MAVGVSIVQHILSLVYGGSNMSLALFHCKCVCKGQANPKEDKDLGISAVCDSHLDLLGRGAALQSTGSRRGCEDGRRGAE